MLFCTLCLRMIQLFFHNHLLWVKNLIDTFEVIYLFFRLKANLSLCEIAGLVSLKRVLQAICGLKFINLTKDTINILGVHFSYSFTLKVQYNFVDTVKSIQQVLCFWNSRMLSLEGKIVIFKTLPISKIVYLTFLTVISKSLTEELSKIKKRLYGTPHILKLVNDIATLKVVV